ncbi:Glycosyl transferases group 1 [Brevibacterium casei]|uniref:Glycosyl transferases group 1 n=1 Tax=Brevibacterium casei TaxID=33889 RepID=A0A449DB49_9MICO|nr:glycosyltransferase [Brevibacterium casei]VEW14735.1 Glycosyl transferases group 1 [Brevibacterium casei]
MRILLYADLDLRLIDGSSTWLASLAEVLAAGNHRVHLLSKVRFSESRVLERLRRRYPGVELHVPDQEGLALSPEQAASRAVQLHEQYCFDIAIVRGLSASLAFSNQVGIRSVLWSYITDLPFPLDHLSDFQAKRLNQIAATSRRMFAQTEAARSYLETIAPAAAGKTLLMPPMIPDEAFADSSYSDQHTEVATRLSNKSNPLRLIYAGKLAKQWHTYEMLALPSELAARGLSAELVIVGDKFQHDAQETAWASKMRESLVAADEDPESRVTWLGGVDRDRVLLEIRKADIGIGWRSHALDSSLEVSTKALEYAACSTAPLVNLSSDHCDLWGKQYPLLVRSDASAEEIAELIAFAVPDLPAIASCARDVAVEYSMSSAVARLNRLVERGVQAAPVSVGRKKVIISSHDFKFLGELVDGLGQRSDVDLHFDGWTNLHEHDEPSSLKTKTNADVVLCEWAGPSLVWHAEHKTPGTKLVVRLHGFELRGPWLNDLEVNKVDNWIFVSERYRRLTVEQLRLDPSKTSVIPNMIDCEDLNRPKLEGSEFQLGMVGIVGFGKRPDRALDLMQYLLEYDDRFTLRFKGRPPWDYNYEWRDPLQRQLYLDFYERIRKEDRLRNRVVFESFSPDIASWLRGVGFVLSPSHNESFHLAPVEGMASGAVPVVWRRPGAEEIFGNDWLVNDAEGAANVILDLTKRNATSEAAGRAQAQALQWDRNKVLARWFDMLELP